MPHVLVVGGGVAGLLTTQALLDRADDLADDDPADDDLADDDLADDDLADDGLAVTLLVHRHGVGTASRSGGLAMRYASTDPRSDAWTARSAVLADALAARHAHLRPHLRRVRPLVVSRRGPVTGYPGDPVRPAALGLPHHGHGVQHVPTPQWDTCALLARWPDALAADPRVRVVALPDRLGSVTDLLDRHDEHRADVTVACLGLGAHVLGDTRLQGRMGVLLRGPLPRGSVHAERAVVDDDDPLRPRYTVPHRSAADAADDGVADPAAHLHVGGTYLPVDDPRCWDDPGRLAAEAAAEVPALLADVRRLFPDLASWEPDAPPWWGLRPVRDAVVLARLDPAVAGRRRVVVSHGWGGSGWTIGPAVAEDTARHVLPGRGAGARPDPSRDPVPEAQVFSPTGG